MIKRGSGGTQFMTEISVNLEHVNTVRASLQWLVDAASTDNRRQAVLALLISSAALADAFLIKDANWKERVVAYYQLIDSLPLVANVPRDLQLVQWIELLKRQCEGEKGSDHSA